jgi:hypothetical protein
VTFSTHPEWDAPDLDPPATTATDSGWKVWLLVPTVALLAFVVTVVLSGAILR